MPLTIVHDATIVTGDDASTIHHGAALAVDGGRIAAIGTASDLLARYPAAERVDGRGRAVLPGLANTHTHLSRVLARGIYEDLSPLTLDEPTLVAEAERVARAAWSRLFAARPELPRPPGLDLTSQ